MGGWLTQIFSGSNISQTTGNIADKQDGQAAASELAMMKGTAALKDAYASGAMLSGKVISTADNQVVISLGNNQTINAAIADGQNLSVGEQILFSVRNIMNNQISISPLLANVATTQTAVDALNHANIVVTEETLHLVNQMMQAGLCIDKESLQTMNRYSSQFPEAQASNLVALKAMGLPITQENIQQIQNYTNLTHQITNSISDIMGLLPEAYESAMATGNQDMAVQMYGDLVQNLAEENFQLEAFLKEPILQEPILQEPALQESANNAASMTGENALVSDEAAATSENQIVQGENVVADKVTVLKALGFSDAQTEALVSKGITEKQILSLIQNHGSEKEAALFGTKAFQNLIGKVAEETFLLDPKQVAEADSVKELYTKLRSQVEKLSETLQKNPDSAIYKSTENLKNNIDFVNQINHLYSYVQLPLKMAGGANTGDLYVYTNKRGMTEKDGNVSALLHLDMEHLGPVDVHVAMNGANMVQTNFYLQDEAMLDFIYSHIDLLDKRLAERGYSMKAAMHIKGESENSVLDEFLPAKGEDALISQYSFDARA